MFRTALTALGALSLATVSHAFPIAPPGTEGLAILVGKAGNVIARFHGDSAAYSNDLFLMRNASGQPGIDADFGNDLFLFNNDASAVGSTADLGAFTTGTELVFRLHVRNTGEDFYTGTATRNPDNHTHARVQEEWLPRETLVSFEDLLNGPFDYNDLSFSFTNTRTTPPSTVPLPGSLLLLGAGVAGLALSNRRLKSKPR